MQPPCGEILFTIRHMYCTQPLQYGTPPLPSSMPCLLQEMANRWCHRYVCLVLTIEFYGSTYPVKLRLTLSSLLIHFCIKVSISVTICIIFFKIRSFSTLKSCPNYTHCAKVGSKFCQTLNKPSTI